LIKLITFTIKSIGFGIFFYSLFHVLFHLYSVTTYQQNSDNVQVKNFDIWFMSPYKVNVLNSMYSENINQPKIKSEFSSPQRDFIVQSILKSTSKLEKQTTRTCIIENSVSYPQHFFPDAWVSNFTKFNPQDNLDSITTKKQQLYFSLLRDELPDQTAAYATVNSLSTTLKSNDINVPGLIYLNKSTLLNAMEHEDYEGYGATIVHEILHLYNHEHPGSTPEERYDPPYFINTVELCLRK
jgi:hypothetical protein